jgi:hypothetical protein
MWTLGYVLGAAVVVVVAALLIAILLVARSIEQLAGQALAVAGEIRAATRPIWAVAEANEVIEDIAATARSIESQVAAIADGLAPAEGGGP